MRNKHKLFWMSGMLAGAVALGCQTVPQVVPGGPRMVVHYGAVKLEPDADMAIVFNRLDCKESDYALQQAAGPDPRVDHIKVEITGTGLVDPLKKTLTRSQFTGCDATLNLTGLAPGQYQVRFTSYNAAGDPVAYANGLATVALGTTPQLNLVCDFNMGSLDVNIHCCEGSPTPVPASPTPVPASPTPVPTPAPPAVITASDIGDATGFAVDDQSNVYIFGFNPGTGWTPLTVPAFAASDEGRIVKVAGQSVDADWYDDVSAFHEGEIVLSRDGAGNVTGRKLLAESITYWYNSGGAGSVASYIHQVDLDTPGASTLLKTPFTHQSPWSASTVDESTGAFYLTNGSNLNFTTLWSWGVQRFADPGVYARTPFFGAIHPDTQPPNESTRAISMSWDATNGVPVWASNRGILRTQPGAAVADAPLFEVDLAGADASAYGMILVGTSPTRALFTQYGIAGAQSVYYAEAGGTPAEAFAFTNGFPYRIEKGLDGYVYVMLSSENVSTMHVARGFRIVQMLWDDASRTLTPVKVVADKFAAGAPASW